MSANTYLSKLYLLNRNTFLNFTNENTTRNYRHNKRT